MNKQALKKHHFWILTGLAPLLTLIAVVLIWNDVGAEVSAQAALVSAKMSELKGANPKGEKVLRELEDQKGVLTVKRTDMWKQNYAMQRGQLPINKVDLFTWPVDTDPRQRLRKLEEKYTKFGEPMQDIDEAFEVFRRKEVYEEAYQQAADSIKPTYFTNARNWKPVFRHVTQWGERKPTSTQIWLALEDYWLQRAMIQPINQINDGARLFRRVPNAPNAPDDKFHRTFESRVWRIELRIPQEGPEAGKVVRGKITNITDRLQIFGIGNRLMLKIWLSDLPNAQPMLMPVEGEFVKAGETRDIKFLPRQHTIPPGMEVQQLFKIERVLDEYTAPVRQVLNMEMQYMDSRNGTAAMKAPEWWTPADDAPVAAAAGPGGSPGAVAETSGATADLGLSSGAKTRVKAGPPQRVLNGNKLRYFDITKQVRRTPVAIVLLIDQMFMQDALVAYSNSPLRYQITQFHWSRYRRPIAPPTATTDAGVGGMMSGSESSGSSSSGYPGGSGEAGFGQSGTGAPTAVDAGQVTSGLVALTIYGIASLYERVEAPPADATTPPAGTPTPAAPAPATPAPPAGVPPAEPRPKE